MIIRRKAKPFGTGAHVCIPKDCIGEEVIIITEEDILRFEDMFFEVLAFRKAKEQDDTEALAKVKALESKIDWLIELLKVKGVLDEEKEK